MPEAGGKLTRNNDWSKMPAHTTMHFVKEIGAAKFKEQCLAILDHLDRDGIVITKHGKPVAKLIPVERSFKDLIGSLRGRIKIKGDIQTTGVKWDADS